MFYPKGWSERERGIELAQAAVFYDLPAINIELRARNSRRAKGSIPLPFLEDVDEADGRGCAGVDPVVETRALLDMIGGAEFLRKTPSRGRGRPLEHNKNMFIVAVMNRWMSLAPPKDKRRGRRRERMSFRGEWQKHHTLNRPFPVPPRPGPAWPVPWRFLPRVWTAWPVPKGDFAPKRRPSAIVATIVLAEAGAIDAPQDEAAFGQALETVERAYRRWHAVRFKPDRHGAMKEMRTWLEDALREAYTGGG